MGTKKILIVDDEKDMLTLLGARLMKAGYSVIKADNGQEAIKLAKLEKPDLAILDIIMPDMGGEEIAMEMKNDPETKDIPVMFLTCLVTKKEESEMGRQIGSNFFFAKPYEAKELLNEIEKKLQLGS